MREYGPGGSSEIIRTSESGDAPTVTGDRNRVVQSLATMFSLPAFLGASITTGWFHDLCVLVAWSFAIPALGLSYYAAAKYVPEGRRALREGRAARLATPDGVGPEGAR